MDGEIVEQRVVHARWSTVSEATLRMPDGTLEPRMIEDHGDAAAVLLYNVERRSALLVRQPRAPVLYKGAEPLIEVVAGRTDGKSGEATARAEALEEVGLVIRSIERVATLWMMPAVSTERIELFLAAYVDGDRVTAGGGAVDENEGIAVVEMPLNDLRDLADGDRLPDGKTYLLVQALRSRRPELFDA